MRSWLIGVFVSALLAVFFFGSSTTAQRAGAYPGFTLVMQTTDFDAKGATLSSRTYTKYHSNTGDWRSVGTFGGYELATVYRRGRGVYISNARTSVLLKTSDHAPGCPLRTAEQLQRDPKFARTEMVLGLKAYVLSQRLSAGGLVETYWAPELGGGTPFRRIYNFDDGRKITEEPISITLGEPAATDVSGPDYKVIEQVPIFNDKLSNQILSKPDPIYPVEAQARDLSGIVCIQVIVDESGRVLSARSSTRTPFLVEAAVEAAYQAWFSPTIVDGKPVITEGRISYQFVPPQVSKN